MSEPTTDREQALGDAMLAVAATMERCAVELGRILKPAKQPAAVVSQEDVAAVESVIDEIQVALQQAIVDSEGWFTFDMENKEAEGLLVAWARLKEHLGQPASLPSEPSSTIQSAIRDMCDILCDDKATDDEKRVALNTLREAIEPSPEIDLEKGWPEAPIATTVSPDDMTAMRLLVEATRHRRSFLAGHGISYVQLGDAYVAWSRIERAVATSSVTVGVPPEAEPPITFSAEPVDTERGARRETVDPIMKVPARLANVIESSIGAVSHNDLERDVAANEIAEAVLVELASGGSVERTDAVLFRNISNQLDEAREQLAAERQSRNSADRESARLKNLLHRDQTGLAHSLNNVLVIIGGWGWLSRKDEWGSYDYEQHTVETLRKEIGWCFDKVEQSCRDGLRESGVRANAAFRPEKDRIAELEQQLAAERAAREVAEKERDEARAISACLGQAGIELKQQAALRELRATEDAADANKRLADEWERAEKAEQRHQHAAQFYGVRWERLKALIKDNALHIWDEAAAIMANGTASVSEPPTYDQQMNILRHRAEKAEKDLAEAGFDWSVLTGRIDELEQQLAAVTAERDKLQSAIKAHHDQRLDDRCWMDDDTLYAVAGLPPADVSTPPREKMLVNCARFIDQRCKPGPWKSYQELEAELEAARPIIAKAAELRDECDRLVKELAGVKASNEALNAIIRERGYGQGQIDNTVADWPFIEELREKNGQLTERLREAESDASELRRVLSDCRIHMVGLPTLLWRVDCALNSTAGRALLDELADVKVKLESYEREFKHAVECVDRVFQEDSEKSPPLLPDFLLGGADKFEGVVELAEAYLDVKAKLAEAEARRPKAIPWPLTNLEELVRAMYEEEERPWCMADSRVYGTIEKMLRRKLEQAGVVFEEAKH